MSESTRTIHITGTVIHNEQKIKGTVEMPAADAERLLAIGPHVAVPAEPVAMPIRIAAEPQGGEPQAIEQQGAEQQGAEPQGTESQGTTEQTLPAVPVDPNDFYDTWTKEELEAHASDRNLDVVRADGKDSEPLKADYVLALRADDKARAEAQLRKQAAQ